MSYRRIVIAAILIAAGFYTQWLVHPASPAGEPNASRTATRTPTATPPPAKGMVRVTRVVDGDTIEIEGGTKVRYLGMNTPETVHPTKPVECFGHEASNYNKSLLSGGLVRLVKDITNTDKYGRLLRYVYLPDGTFVNLTLVTDGYAYADTYPPDVAHAREFVAAQAAARQQRLGLWASCPVK